ncbi:MAG TPA: type II toxin-antitoxin system death-on-curing family toxin [Ktedonobacterales bacterium]
MARYLSAEHVREINHMILAAEGAQSLLRDQAALEAAVVRPQQYAFYQQSDLIDQAVALILGIALNHPFVDANKRTAAIADDTFLRLNGLFIEPDAPTAYGELILQAVTTDGSMRTHAEDQLGIWLHNRTREV